MINAERILKAVAYVVKSEGKTIFTRDDIYTNIPDELFYRPSYDPTFQGMRIDQPGGAPSQREVYRNVFEQVEHGHYRLTAYGERLIEDLESAGWKFE